MRSSRPSSPRPGAARSLLIGVVLALAACGPVAAPSGGVAVRDAWLRAPVSGTSAGYLVITNTNAEADTLTGVTSPSGAMISMHKTTTDPSGMTGMTPVDGIHVPAGGTSELAPGGFHLMIEGLPASVSTGGSVELDLHFEHAGTIVVQAEVRGG